MLTPTCGITDINSESDNMTPTPDIDSSTSSETQSQKK